MSSEAGRLGRNPELRDSLRRLRATGPRLIAMSNSPTESVMDTFEQIGISGCFDAIVADASKPAGLIAFLRDDADPGTTLSIGDNYVNDIEPALDAGALALYIDRHHTGLGADRPGCTHVTSIDAAWEWLRGQT
jgi:putative hydrolase of the HAD superfamily